MSWNGSDRARQDFTAKDLRQPCQQPRKSRKAPLALGSAGIILIGLVMVGLYALPTANKEGTDSHSGRSRSIGHFNRITRSNQKVHKHDNRGSTNKVELVKVLFEPKRQIVQDRIHTNGAVSVSFEERVFPCPSDQKIAAIVLSEPGACVAGDPSGLYDDFDKEFVESLLNPIEISQDDPEEVRELKLAVIDIREDMKNRKRNGENLQKVMEDSWLDLRRLGEFKESMENELQGCALDASYTERDIDDFIEAANIMLRDKGCSPLSNETIIREFAKHRIKKALESANDGDSVEE